MTPTPDQLRARADREESVYAQATLAAMLRAGADAMEERDRLREALSDVTDPDFIWDVLSDTIDIDVSYMDLAKAVSAKQRVALTPPAEVYDWNDRYDAKWEPEVKG